MNIVESITSVISKLYTDTVSVYRSTPTVNPDGTTDTIRNTTTVYTNIPCRISFTRAWDRPDKQIDGENPIEYRPTIHCSPEYSIVSGDYLEVKRVIGNSFKMYKGMAGDPRVYESHQEILIYINEGS